MNQDWPEAIPRQRAVSLEREVFTTRIGRDLYDFQTESRFVDIGTPFFAAGFPK